MAGSYPIRSSSIPLAGRGAVERLAKLIGRQPDYGELYGMLRQAGRNVELATALLLELMRGWARGGHRDGLAGGPGRGERSPARDQLSRERGRPAAARGALRAVRGRR